MIKLNNLSKSFNGRKILDNISYYFPPSHKVALVGANGAGKSTLLNIICGLEKYDEGNIDIPKQVVLGYLPQEPEANPEPTIWLECISGARTIWQLEQEKNVLLEKMGAGDCSEETLNSFNDVEQLFFSNGGYELEGLVHKVLLGLRFSEADFEKDPKSLSGGWRMRLELAKVLVNQPDFLVLDEPTNHLDLPSLEWLERYLVEFKGTILFVSHDQEFLNNLATKTLHINAGVVREYSGNFDFFLEQRELRQAQTAASAKNIQDRTKEVQRFVDRFRKSAAKSGQIGSRLKMLSKLRELENALPTEARVDEIVIRLPVTQPSGKVVVRMEGVDIGYQTPLIKKLDLTLLRGQKLAIIGQNGLGKSTFLKTLVGNLKPVGGEYTLGHNVNIGYFSQDQDDGFDENLPIFEQLKEISVNKSDLYLRKLLGGFLFKGQDAFKLVKVLSGGERSRLRLCSIITKEPNFLILDEPTNHLDMQSITLLADAMSEYEGTVVFVSHNRSFINEVATDIFELTEKCKLVRVDI